MRELAFKSFMKTQDSLEAQKEDRHLQMKALFILTFRLVSIFHTKGRMR